VLLWHFLPARQSLQDWNDFLCDREFRVRRERVPARRDRLRHRQGLQQRQLRYLFLRRFLSARQSLQDRNDFLCDRKFRVRRERVPAGRDYLRHRQGLQQWQLRHLFLGRFLSARRSLQDRNDLLWDRKLRVCRERVPAGRDRLRHRQGL
jgi:hypothetical protein